jgi:hypothetical protein
MRVPAATTVHPPGENPAEGLEAAGLSDLGVLRRHSIGQLKIGNTITEKAGRLAGIGKPGVSHQPETFRFGAHKKIENLGFHLN